MAKRRKKLVFKYNNVLYGTIFLVLSILGIGALGIVGRIIQAISLFLVGSLYYPLLVFIFIIGLLQLFKNNIDFFSKKLIGIYIILITTSILFHINYLNPNEHSMTILNNTFNNLFNSTNQIIKTGTINNFFLPGGGIIGGILGIIFLKLFSYWGLIIVSTVLILMGIIMITEIRLISLIKDKLNKIKLTKEQKNEIKEEEISKTKAHVIINNSSEEKEDTRPTLNELKAKKEEEIKPTFITNPNYQLPSFSLLDINKNKKGKIDNSLVEANIETLESVLRDFGISGQVVEVHVGPTVAQYELEIASGTRVNKITSINREIALALAKKDVRIQAPIPGKKTVGIEFANDNPTPVSFHEIISSKDMVNAFNEKLNVPLGKTIMGEIGTCRIDKMPHLLIAGTTGSGKSVCVNGIICSILMRATPDEVKLAMVDPKVVELNGYNGIPHLMCPVVNDPKQASILLQKMVAEMENRYRAFEKTRVKNIESYNKYIDEYNSKNSDKLVKMPFIVIIIDELADLMMVAAKEVEDSILRITQKARAAGMHLIVATQRPSTEVITGLIKANIPSRISFAVGSGIDSRTILDQTGAEKLLGKGDMLYLPIGSNSPLRIQGSFINDNEIKRIVEYVSKQQEVNYDESLLNLSVMNQKTTNQSDENNEEKDALYDEIVEYVIKYQTASTSFLQRKFKVGYNRAGRIMDQLEEAGIIGPPNGSKPREVLLKPNIEEE